MPLRPERRAPAAPGGCARTRRECRYDEGQRLLDRVHATTDTDQLSVVVLAGQGRGLDAPRKRATRTGNLVSGNLFTVARSTQHDAQAVRVGHRARCGCDTKGRVIILGVVAERTAVDRLVSGRLKVLDDLLFELEAGMIGSQVDAHARHLSLPNPSLPTADQSNSGRSVRVRLSSKKCG